MEIIVVECPVCKRKIQIDRTCDKTFCMHCRIEIQVKRPSTDEAALSRDFIVKMAIAERFGELHSIGGKSFAEVMSAYDDAGAVGSHHVEYWLARARFYAKGMLRELSKGEVISSEQRAIIDQYTVLMYTASKYDSVNKEAIETEKTETITKISEAFKAEEGKRDRKRSRLTTGLLAIPFAILLLVFHLDDRTNYDNLANDEPQNWAIAHAAAEEDSERIWPVEYVERWEDYLAEVRTDNINFEETQYSNFLGMEYLVEIMTVRPTRDGLESMEMELSEGLDTLYNDGRSGEHSLQFIFNDSSHPESLSTIQMDEVTYLDGLALYRLVGYNISDIAAVFAINYNVHVYYWPEWNMISFEFEGIDFEIHSFSAYGATVIVSSPLIQQQD